MINFGVGKQIAVPTRLADGSVIATPTPVVLGSMQDISVDMNIELKKVHGSGRYPIAIGQGKGEISIKAKQAEISGAILGSLVYGKAATPAIKGIESDKPAAIPATGPFTFTPTIPNSGTFVMDLGLFLVDTGQQLRRVAATPAAGEYMVSPSGQYTFAAADAGKGFLYSLEYSATSTTGQVFNLTNEIMGSSPSFSMLLKTSFDGQNMVMKLSKCTSGKMNLPLKNDDFAIYDFEAEAFADSAGNVGYLCMY